LKANGRALRQDQHRMRMHLANMRSSLLSLHELVSQRPRCTSHPARHGLRPRIFSTPTATRDACRAQTAFSPVQGRPNRSAAANAATQLFQARGERRVKACGLMDPTDQVQDCRSGSGLCSARGRLRSATLDRSTGVGLATSQD
jgi:hypothetical protein